MEIVLFIWAVVAGFWLFMCAVLLACTLSGEQRQREQLSRGMFLSVVWPMVVLYWIWLGFAGLWNMTGWDLKVRKRK